MTPVVILSDGYVANGAEPWRIPKLSDLPPIPVTHPEPPGRRDLSTPIRETSDWLVLGRFPARQV
jgi:2-oxoglutarate/2-oxoacid ferredoxin oxidoreductase subunit alpha